VFKTRYLLLMALMILLINWINTTGEYILGSIVKEQASAMVAGGTNRGLSEAQIIGGFYAKYFSLANVTGLLLQLFVVSRLIKHRGVGVAVMILPAISFGVYNVLIFVPLLSAALAAKVIENSTDYSLNNTVRNMLFLPCTYEQKFAAKQAIDSFFVRMGDVLSAALVFAGTFLALSSQGFAAVNAVLAVLALILAWRVGRY
jgi:AAA family ATP:ADP antiporter